MVSSSTRSLVKLHTLRLVREGSFAAEATTSAVRSPRDAYRFIAPYADREVPESFWMLPLNAQHMVIKGAPIVITRGLLTSSLVHAREVFRPAIIVGAAAIIVAHNHPSGDPTPSSDDRMVTEMLVAAGKLLDIPLHDHIVCGAGRYVSFAEIGLL